MPAEPVAKKTDNMPEKVECESMNNVDSQPDPGTIKALQQELTDIKMMLKELAVNMNAPAAHHRMASNTSSTNAIKSEHFFGDMPIPIIPLEIDSTAAELSKSPRNLYVSCSPEMEPNNKYYAEEHEYFDQKPTLRERIRFYLIDSMGKLGFAIDLFILTLILWSLVMFILSTEDIEVFEIEAFLTIVFAIEYTLRCYASRNMLQYIFSFHGMIDCISFLPSLIAMMQGSDLNLSFLRAFRTLRAFRLFRYTIGSKAKSEVGDNIPIFNGLFHLNSLHIQLYRSAFTVSVIILVISGLMFFAEGPDSDLEVPTVANFFESLYFTIVAISTVGFGEISPGGVGGQLIMIFAIPICIVMLPLQASLIGDAYEKFQQKMDEKELDRRSSWTLQDLVEESRLSSNKWKQRFSCTHVPRED